MEDLAVSRPETLVCDSAQPRSCEEPDRKNERWKKLNPHDRFGSLLMAACYLKAYLFICDTVSQK